MSAGQMSPSAATPGPALAMRSRNFSIGRLVCQKGPPSHTAAACFAATGRWLVLLDAQLTGTDGLRLQEQRDWVPYEYLNNSNLRLPRTFAMSRLKIRYCTGCEAKRGRSTGELNVVNWRVFTGV